MGTGGAVRQLRFAWRGGAWVAVYLVFVLAPLFALLIGPLPPRATSVAICRRPTRRMNISFARRTS